MRVMRVMIVMKSEERDDHTDHGKNIRSYAEFGPPYVPITLRHDVV